MFDKIWMTNHNILAQALKPKANDRHQRFL